VELLKIIGLSFVTIFLAELGDKTQLAVLVLRSRGWSWPAVFSGAMLAFAVLTLLALLFGGFLQSRVSPALIRKFAAVLFVVLGVGIWFDKL